MKWCCIDTNPGQESSPPIDIGGGNYISTVAFAANGEVIVGGGQGDKVGVWRVEDRKEMALMAARDYVYSLAVSKDGRWIAAGTYGEVLMWDAKTFEKVFSHKEDNYGISGVDFSPDSTRLVTASYNNKAAIWDVATRQKALSLDHERFLVAAKYSPQGDRIATATLESVRVWDSNDGRLLVHIPVKEPPHFNTGLLWSENHLFVVSDSTLKQSETYTGSTVSEWLVPGTNYSSRVALPKHGEFIVYSTNDTVTFWDTSAHIQLGLIQHTQPIRSIALSPDDQFLAIGASNGEIAIKDLRDVWRAPYSTVSIVYCRL